MFGFTNLTKSHVIFFPPYFLQNLFYQYFYELNWITVKQVCPLKCTLSLTFGNNCNWISIIIILFACFLNWQQNWRFIRMYFHGVQGNGAYLIGNEVFTNWCKIAFKTYWNIWFIHRRIKTSFHATNWLTLTFKDITALYKCSNMFTERFKGKIYKCFR